MFSSNSKRDFLTAFSDSRWKLLCVTSIKTHFIGNWQRCGEKAIFVSVWRVLVSHLVFFDAYCLVCGNWILDACGEYIIWTTNWFLQVSFEFKGCLFCREYILKDTNLLVSTIAQQLFCVLFPQWSFSRDAGHSVHSSVFVVEKYGPFCVNLIFWMEPTNCFEYFFLKSLFFSMLWLCPLLCFCVEMNFPQHIIKTYPILTRIFPMNRYLKCVYRQSTCWW